MHNKRRQATQKREPAASVRR